MLSQITIRPTSSADLPRVDALLRESYPALLKHDYPPSVLVTALPIISRANPSLLRSGTYYVAEDGEGEALAAGGWSHSGPAGRRGPTRPRAHPARGHASSRAPAGARIAHPRVLLPRGARAGDHLDDGAIHADGGALLPRDGLRGAGRDRGDAAPRHRLPGGGDGARPLSRASLTGRSSRPDRGRGRARPEEPPSAPRPIARAAGRSGSGRESPS
jgi:hypothetical protein